MRKYPDLIFLMAVSLFSAAALMNTAVAQGPGGGPSTEQLLDEMEARNAEFDSFGWPARGRFAGSTAFLESYKAFNKKLWRDHGIGYIYAPTVMTQSGTQASNDFTANFQHNILFYWRAFENTRFGTGAFVANGLQIRQLTNTTGVDFSQALGINFFSSDSPADSDTLKALYWRQDFPGDVFSLRIGHDELSGIVNRCTYACDDTTSFFSTLLSANPASTLPGQGMAAIAGFNFNDSVSLEVGVADANGDATLNLGRPFDTGKLAYAGTVTLNDPFKLDGTGAYRFSYYHVDPTKQQTASPQASSSGFAINFDQDVGELGLFARYANASGRTGQAEQFASTGAVWKKPFGYDEDRLGFGFGWVDPSAANTNSEYVVESYYRMQLTPLTTVTVDVMAVINPSNNLDEDLEFVFSLRARAHF